MSRFVMPLQSAFAQNVKPFDGAQLFFFSTGSSNDLDTFSDSALTTQNANPVIADGDGRFPSIFLGSGSIYKVVLKDKKGKLIWEEDPIEDSINAADVSFTNTGTGALPTTVDAWMKSRLVRIADFGDITVDIGAAINNAIAAGKKGLFISEGGPFPQLTAVDVPTDTYIVGAGKRVSHIQVAADIVAFTTKGLHTAFTSFMLDVSGAITHTKDLVQIGTISPPVASDRCEISDFFVEGAGLDNIAVLFSSVGSVQNVTSINAGGRTFLLGDDQNPGGIVVGWAFSGVNDFRGAGAEPLLIGYDDLDDSRSHGGGGLILCQASAKPVIINGRSSVLNLYCEGLDTAQPTAVSVVLSAGSDYTCIAPHTSSNTTAKVIGTDGNDYSCFRIHKATSANEPITGSDFAKYWVLDGSGSGSVWVDGTTYSASNEPGVGPAWPNKWTKLPSSSGTPWANTTVYTAGRRQLAYGDSAQGNRINLVNGNRVVDSSADRDNITSDKDIGGGSPGYRGRLEVDGLTGSFKMTNGAGTILGGLEMRRSTDLEHDFVATDSGSTQTIRMFNEGAGDLNLDVDGALTCKTISASAASPLRTITGTVVGLADTASSTILTAAQLGTTSAWIISATTDGVTSDRSMVIVFGKTPTVDVTDLISNNIALTAAGTGDLQLTNNTGGVETFKFTALQLIA